MEKKKIREIIKITLYIVFSPVVLLGIILYALFYAPINLLKDFYQEFIED